MRPSVQPIRSEGEGHADRDPDPGEDANHVLRAHVDHVAEGSGPISSQGFAATCVSTTVHRSADSGTLTAGGQFARRSERAKVTPFALGDFVRKHGLERGTDAEVDIENCEAGQYSQDPS